MLIILKDEDLQQCIQFSNKCALNQQAIEFGQSDTAARSVKEIGRDNLIGKIGEVAFAKMMKYKFNIDVKLDFEYYPRGEWDGQDTIINGWKIDVKATRKGGKWMLIEWSKINFRQRDKDLPDMFVMASVDWDRDADKPIGGVDLVGCASLFKMKKDVSTTKVVRKGDLLPGTHTRLQADNFAIRFEDLQQDWNAVVNYILSHQPLPLDDYPNPYTDETYRTLFPKDYI